MRRLSLTALVICTMAKAVAADIISGTDSGALSNVKAFENGTGVETGSFLAYGAGFTGGVRVATGDISAN